jgi:peroxiredoxin
MISPWRTPMPLEEYTTERVVVYFYSDRWIPISCFCLAEAIALYRKALRLGKEILVFPPDLDVVEHQYSIP